MKLQSVGLVFSLFLSLGFVAFSCSSGDTVGSTGTGTGNTNGTGNTTGQGGTTGTGNSTGRGGTTGTGNTTGQGGTTGTGNTTGIAGTNGTGRGGTTGTGNVTGQGGTTGTGNTTGQGGTTGTGNTTGTGGSGAVACGSSFAVSAAGFVTMPAVGGGCWSGFASDGGDAGSTIAPGTFSKCGSPCALTMTGTLNASTATNLYAGYAYLGFNVGQDSSGSTPVAVTPKGSGLSVSFTNSSGGTVRVALNADTAGATSWCYTTTATSGTIPYSSFTQQCYNTPPGAAYAKQPIVTVQLSVPGAATSGPVNVTLLSVTENP
jgi:hypothetical protein